MMSVYWQPLEKDRSIRRQLDAVFDHSADKLGKTGTYWVPACEMIETAEDFKLRVFLPGIVRSQLDIQATHEYVVISGERPYPQTTEDSELVYSELSYGPFQKVVTPSLDIEPEQVKADFQDGILSLSLPKSDRYRTVKVPVGSAQQSVLSDGSSQASDAHTATTHTTELSEATH